MLSINLRDHNPPHFHAEHGEFRALIDITSGELSEGSLPPAIRKLVLEWAQVRQPELVAAWSRAVAGEHPGKIEPLD